MAANFRAKRYPAQHCFMQLRSERMTRLPACIQVVPHEVLFDEPIVCDTAGAKTCNDHSLSGSRKPYKRAGVGTDVVIVERDPVVLGDDLLHIDAKVWKSRDISLEQCHESSSVFEGTFR